MGRLLSKGIDHYLRIGQPVRKELPGGSHTKVSQYHCPIVFHLQALVRSSRASPGGQLLPSKTSPQYAFVNGNKQSPGQRGTDGSGLHAGLGKELG